MSSLARNFRMKKQLKNNNMFNKKFEAPRVIRLLDIELRDEVLQASLTNNLNVRSTGQEVPEYDFSTDNKEDFNFEWK